MNLETLKLTFKSSYKSITEKYYKTRNESDRQKIIAYLYITISLFTLSFFGFFAIRPTIVTIVNLDKQLKDNREVLEKIKQKQDDLSKLTREYEAMTSDLNLIKKAIPSSANMPYLSRQIETVALRNNVKLTSLDFGSVDVGETNPDGLLSFTVSITAEGNEKDVNLFIRDISSMDRILGFERFSTGKTRKSEFGGVIAMKAYFLPE
jgi:Tfp pilus assembly protein PilO